MALRKAKSEKAFLKDHPGHFMPISVQDEQVFFVIEWFNEEHNVWEEPEGEPGHMRFDSLKDARELYALFRTRTLNEGTGEKWRIVQLTERRKLIDG